jgi:hypothetical protein
MAVDAKPVMRYLPDTAAGTGLRMFSDCVAQVVHEPIEKRLLLVHGEGLATPGQVSQTLAGESLLS